MCSHWLVPSLVFGCSVLVARANPAMVLETKGPFSLDPVETRLCVIAVHSPLNNVELNLRSYPSGRGVIISLAMTKYGNESQIAPFELGENVAIVSRDSLNLTTQLISLFRKKNVLAVFRAGQAKPVLVYKYKGSRKADFGKFVTFHSRGPRGAYSIHTKSLEERGYGIALAKPHGAAVTEELKVVRKVMYKRLAIVHKFFVSSKITKQDEDLLRILDDVIREWLAPQLFLLDYYGVKLKTTFAKYRRRVIDETLADRKAIRKGK